MQSQYSPDSLVSDPTPSTEPAAAPRKARHCLRSAITTSGFMSLSAVTIPECKVGPRT